MKIQHKIYNYIHHIVKIFPLTLTINFLAMLCIVNVALRESQTVKFDTKFLCILRCVMILCFQGYQRPSHYIATQGKILTKRELEHITTVTNISIYIYI